MDDYSDIIDLEHPDPKYHPRMLQYKRAAQFQPFLVKGQRELFKEVEEAVQRSFEPEVTPPIDYIPEDF